MLAVEVFSYDTWVEVSLALISTKNRRTSLFIKISCRLITIKRSCVTVFILCFKSYSFYRTCKLFVFCKCNFILLSLSIFFFELSLLNLISKFLYFQSFFITNLTLFSKLNFQLLNLLFLALKVLNIVLILLL